MLDLADKIIAVLEKRGVPYSRHNDEINCKCLTGTHPDNRPSMWINAGKNAYYCFSCQAKGRASDLLDIEVDEETLRFIKYKKLLNELEKSTRTVKGPVGYSEQLLPPRSDIELPAIWRGLPQDFLLENEVYYCTQGRYKGRLIFPSYDPISQELTGFDARIYDEYNTKYGIEAFAPDAKYLRPSVVKTSEIVWIPKCLLSMNPQTVVLTEGVVDALSLIYMGYPSVANYGLAPFTPERAAQLYALGTQEIIMGLDLDAPAFRALPEIKQSIVEQGFRIGRSLPFVQDMLKFGIKDYNDYLQFKKEKSCQ